MSQRTQLVGFMVEDRELAFVVMDPRLLEDPRVITPLILHDIIWTSRVDLENEEEFTWLSQDNPDSPTGFTLHVMRTSDVDWDNPIPEIKGELCPIPTPVVVLSTILLEQRRAELGF